MIMATGELTRIKRMARSFVEIRVVRRYGPRGGLWPARAQT